MASALGLNDKMLSVNLLPMTPVNKPNAVSFLINEIAAHGLVPEQIIVEFTESEVISRFDTFAQAVKSLKAAGICVAIDHFGAGFAGLQLLSRFQPDRIKISRELITDVHKSGPRQAIIQAIIKCCASLEIMISAVGVENLKSGCGLNPRALKSSVVTFCTSLPEWYSICCMAREK